MKLLQQRKDDFYLAIWKAAGDNYDKYSESMLREFFNHFSEHNTPITVKTKMLWERQKKANKDIWNLDMRLAQWKARNERNGWGGSKKTYDTKNFEL